MYTCVGAHMRVGLKIVCVQNRCALEYRPVVAAPDADLICLKILN